MTYTAFGRCASSGAVYAINPFFLVFNFNLRIKSFTMQCCLCSPCKSTNNVELSLCSDPNRVGSAQRQQPPPPPFPTKNERSRVALEYTMKIVLTICKCAGLSRHTYYTTTIAIFKIYIVHTQRTLFLEIVSDCFRKEEALSTLLGRSIQSSESSIILCKMTFDNE